MTISVPKRERQSNFEMLRLVSILLIIVMHAMGVLFDTSNVINRSLVVFINSFANIGVTLFVFISGYFGIKFRTVRLFEIIGMVWFYTVLLFITEHFVMPAFHIQSPLDGASLKDFIPYFIPVLCKKYWFISCYVVIYCLSPFINHFIDNISQETFRKFLLVYGIFFILAPTFLVFYEISGDLGKGVLNMFFMYAIGRYIRLYGFPRMITVHPYLLSLSMILVIFVANSILSYFGNVVILRFARDNSLFILVEAVAVFYIFSRMSFVCHHVNVLATYVFAIYLCHHVPLDILQSWYASDINVISLWPKLFASIIIAIVVSIVVDVFRHQFVRLLHLWNIVFHFFPQCR
jgi:hypothetical protein